MVLSVRSTTADASVLAPTVTNAIHRWTKILPISELTTFDELLAREASPMRLNTGLLSLLALLALLLAHRNLRRAGLFRAQRTREVGLRWRWGPARATSCACL
jgi:hypothetical protein